MATVLLLVVVIVITVGLIIWGVPTIQDMNSDSIYRSNLNSMTTLNDQIRALATGSLDDMRSSTISMADGTFSVNEDQEVWCISYQTQRDHTIRFFDLEDFDEKVYLECTDGSIADIQNVRVNTNWLMIKSAVAPNEQTSVTNLQVQPVTGSKGYVALMRPTLGAVHLTVEYGGEIIAGAFIVSVDTMSSTVSSSRGTFELRLASGGLTSDYPSLKHVEESMDFRLSPESRTLVANFIILDNKGIASATKGIYDVNLHLTERESGIAEGAKDVRVEIFSSNYDEVWYDHMSEDYKTANQGRTEFTGFAPTEAQGFEDGVTLLLPNNEYPEDNGQVTLKVQTSLMDVNVRSQ